MAKKRLGRTNRCPLYRVFDLAKFFSKILTSKKFKVVHLIVEITSAHFVDSLVKLTRVHFERFLNTFVDLLVEATSAHFVHFL